MCSYASSLQIKLLSSQRRAFLDLRDASPIAMEQLQRILGAPAIKDPVSKDTRAKGMETLVAVERTQNPSRETEEQMQKEEGFPRKERQT
jgi:hypothetical protein